jgi:hypothetical protein
MHCCGVYLLPIAGGVGMLLNLNDNLNDMFHSCLRLLACSPAGDVSVLSGLKESLAKGRHSLSKRMFKKKGASPSKDTLKHTVHEMQDALTSSEEEKNALKRQLAKLSKKYQQVRVIPQLCFWPCLSMLVVLEVQHVLQWYPLIGLCPLLRVACVKTALKARIAQPSST